MTIYGADDRDDDLDDDDPDESFPDVRNDPYSLLPDDPQPVEDEA